MADESPSPRNVEEHVKGLARYALQILALAASVLAALYLGSLLAEGVLGLLAANGGSVRGVAVLISVVREASKLLSSVLEYAAEPSVAGLGGTAGLVFVTAFGISLVLPLLGDPPRGNEESERAAPLLVSVLPHQTPQGAGSMATFFVTWDQDAAPESVLEKRGPGVDLSDAYEAQLDALALGLAACAGQRGQPVEVTIVGMASSSPFDGETEVRSRQLNRDLANLRAQVVADRLREAGGPIEVTTADWTSYEQMIASRAFSDREPDGSYSKEKAVLTRRAEVHVRNAPGCQLELPIRAGRAAAPGSIPRR